MFGILLFVAGSALNSGSEFQRYRWKRDPGHTGRLFTEGLFSLSVHINYFGDLLWVTGYACVTGNIYASGIPVFLFCFFYFGNIPKLDAYLQHRYGQDFMEYRARTKRFVPFLI